MLNELQSMRILLINPFVNKRKMYGGFHKLGGVLPPLGLSYLAGVLLQKGCQVKIVDANLLQLSSGQVIEVLHAYNPDLVGITATTLSYGLAKDLATAIKINHPKLPIIFGGPHAAGFEKSILLEACFDFVVTNEGEKTIVELVEALGDTSKIKAVNGLSWKDGEEIVINPPQEMIEDLDSIPFPARHLLPPLAQYIPKAISYKHLPTTHIFTSRGCPYKCVFCRTSFGKSVRYHSAEYVVEELDILIKNYGLREVIINDDTFILNIERVYKICELIHKRGLKINWSCNVRSNMVDRKLLQTMIKAGCWMVALGMESGNPEVLKKLRKGATLEQGVRACKLAYELGLYVRPSFIIGNPGDTPETVEQTIALAVSLPAHFPSFMLMTPFPGTEIWEKAHEFGTFDHSDICQLQVSSKASFVPYGLTADYMEKKCKEGFKRAYMNPHMAWRHLAKIRSVYDVKKLVRNALDFLG